MYKKAGLLLTLPKVLRQAEVGDKIEASQTRNFFNLSLNLNILVSHHLSATSCLLKNRFYVRCRALVQACYYL